MRLNKIYTFFPVNPTLSRRPKFYESEKEVNDDGKRLKNKVLGGSFIFTLHSFCCAVAFYKCRDLNYFIVTNDENNDSLNLAPHLN